jgi:DNA-binding transcriptional MerR regulator
VTDDLQSIGPVAEATGLSLRTIRYYEEIGLVTPSGRSAGGFRLYDDRGIERLLLIKRMKPLGYPLEEMGQLLHLVDALDDTSDPDLSPQQARNSLPLPWTIDERIVDLQTKVIYAQEFRQLISKRSNAG